MKNSLMKKLTAYIITVIMIMMITIVPGAVFADEEDSTTDYTYLGVDGEYSADFVRSIVDYLAVYARDGVTEKTLYKAGLLGVLESNPELYELVLDAMMSSIDEHSFYYTSEEYSNFASSLEGAVGGIGVTIDTVNGAVTISEIHEGSPAESAGLMAGDVIVNVDGTDVEGYSQEKVIGLVRGTIGTDVTIGVRRSGISDTIYFTITRYEIAENQSVSYAVLNCTDENDSSKTHNIMYIKISTFRNNSADQFAAAMDEASSLGIKEIIIDLRDNGGGYLNQAIEIANYFVPEGGNIVTEDHKIDLFDVTYTADNTHEDSKGDDVVVLVNENSASASEVLTAAIRQNDAGVVIGTQTYGKGTVQTVAPLIDGGMLKYTAAYYLTPNGDNIDGIGITPDAVVENSYVPFDYSGYEDFDYTAIYEYGDADANVAKAKKIFAVWGWYADDTDNEYFDSSLALAITQFQASEDLFPYGVLDLTTQAALYKALTETTTEVDDQLTAAFSHFGAVYNAED